ncbi:MAG: LLM class flavin-dependent oxidoreductase [Actinomycetota bacterium]
MSLPLSVLDLSPVAEGVPASRALHNTLHLATVADRLGYARYWLAEHHNLPAMACPSPEVMIGQVAARTRRIRVGAGGIMLPNHSPLRIAEAFRVLEALYPGRIDLGVGRAPGTDGVTAYALRRGAHHDDAPSLIAELLAYVDGGFPDDHPFRGVTAEPRDVPLPPLYVLGSSDFGARLAATLGVGFAFARHMNPRGAEEVMGLYRASFRPGRLAEPHAILAVSAVCADTAGRAEELVSSMGLAVLRMRLGRPTPLPSPRDAMAARLSDGEADEIRRYRRAQVVGEPGAVRDEIAALAERTAADEVMVLTMVYDHAERVRSYQLLAEAFALDGAGADLPDPDWTPAVPAAG